MVTSSEAQRGYVQTHLVASPLILLNLSQYASLLMLMSWEHHLVRGFFFEEALPKPKDLLKLCVAVLLATLKGVNTVGLCL